MWLSGAKRLNCWHSMDVLEACKDPSVVDQVVVLHIRMYVYVAFRSVSIRCMCL